MRKRILIVAFATVAACTGFLRLAACRAGVGGTADGGEVARRCAHPHPACAFERRSPRFRPTRLSGAFRPMKTNSRASSQRMAIAKPCASRKWETTVRSRGRSQISASIPASEDRRPGGEQQSTLRYLDLERDNIEALSKIPVFPLVTSNLPKYKISYQGKQPVDELSTYVFEVKPRQLERAHAYFDGLVWVDDHDLTIVKSYGKWVTETGDFQPSKLPFAIFETYRQPVADKYWLPAYSRSDGSYDNRGASVPVRLIIRWEQYTPLPAADPSRQNSPEPIPAH